MKITDIAVLAANRFLYVKIYTDCGLYGIGESGCWGFLDASAEAVNSFKTYLIGKDPLQTEHHWQYMYRCFHFRGAAVMGALSAIDIALWDIKGKYYKVPIYELLGGKCRDKIRVYYHVGGSTEEALLASCQRAKALGYTAVGHLSPFLDEPRSSPYYTSYANLIGQAAERVSALRNALGNNIDLCLELHRRLKPAEAIAFSRQVESSLPMFLEDPIIPDNFDDMAYVAKSSPVPIATGERIHTLQEFAMLLERRAMAYVRVSVCLCGGITGTKKIAALAEAHGAQLVPHNPLSPVSTAACMQIAAAIENFSILELPDHNGVAASERYTSAETMEGKTFCQKDLVTWIPECKNGFAQLQDASGLGIDLQEAITERFPYQRREIQTRLHIDGSIVDQ